LIEASFILKNNPLKPKARGGTSWDFLISLKGRQNLKINPELRSIILFNTWEVYL
jgi:hypothetical protein